jgi:tetratricopeptide (TPR) repeat protein
MQRANDVDLQMETALTHGRIGLIQRELGGIQEALAAFQRALDIYESSWAQTRNTNVASRLAATYHDMALIHRMAGRLQDANEWYLRALKLDEQLVAEMPQDVERQRGMAKTLSNLGVLATATGAQADALDWGRRACDILATIAERTLTADDRMSWARGLINFSQSQSADATAGLATLEQADRLLKDLASKYPEQQEYRIQRAKCLHNLGIAQIQTDQGPIGRETIRQAIELNRRLVNDNPQVQELRHQSATSMYVLAALELNAGEISTSIQLSEESQRELQTLLDQSSENPDYLSLSGLILHQSGELLGAAGEKDQAIEKYELAIGRQEQALALAPASTSYRQFLKSHKSALQKLRSQSTNREADK